MNASSRCEHSTWVMNTGPFSVAGYVPPPPFRVWVRVGSGLGLASRKGWVARKQAWSWIHLEHTEGAICDQVQFNLVTKMRLGGGGEVQGGNHGNPAQPTTRTPIKLIISGELHSILTKGSAGKGNDRDRSAGNRSMMVAKRERMAQNVLSALPWAWNHVIASNGCWLLTADRHWRDVNFA